MMNVLLLCIFLIFLVLTTLLLYVSLQRINYEVVFQKNSTSQIKIFILIISLATGFIIATGVIRFFELLINALKSK